MRNVFKFILSATLVLFITAITISYLEDAKPGFIIPGKLLYRPYLDCRNLGGAQVLELRLKNDLFHIKALCGTGLIYEYVYTVEGEPAPGAVPNLDPGIFEQLDRAVK